MRKAHVGFVQANLTAPEVSFVADNRLWGLWNVTDALPNPLDWFASWRDALKTALLENDSSTCPSGSNSPQCLGYAPGYLPVNWIGADNYGIPAWNSWADGGDFLGLLNAGLPGLPSETGLTAFLGQADLTLNPVRTGNQFGNAGSMENENKGPQAASAAAGTIVVWISQEPGGRRILGQVLPLGSPPSGVPTEIDIGDGFVPGAEHVSVAGLGSQAFVVWRTSVNGFRTGVRGRMIGLSSGTPIGGTFDLSSADEWDATTLSLHEYHPTVVAGTDRFVVAWVRERVFFLFPFGNITDSTARIRTFDGLGAPVSADLVAHSASGAPSSQYLFLAAQGERALVRSSVGGGPRTSFVDLSGSGTVSAPPLIDGIPVERPMIVEGNRGLVAWHSGGTVFAQAYDLAGQALLGSSLQLSNAPGVSQHPRVLGFGGNRALVHWTMNRADASASEIRGRVINLTTGTFEGPDTLLVGNLPHGLANNNQHRTHSALIPGAGEALLVFGRGTQQFARVYARRVALTPLAPVGNLELISKSTPYHARWPVVTGNADGMVLFWEGLDNEGADFLTGDSDIYARWWKNGSTAGTLTHGLNNFFVAPLIEREFDVTATIK